MAVYVNILGAGLAGMTAARTLAKNNIHVRLFSVQVSQRAQSNLAEGGLNAALNMMGEDDDINQHYEDTMKGGCYIANPDMVKGLCEGAPSIVDEMKRIGVPWHMEDGHIIQRPFGGQKKRRTCFCMSSTGKILTTASIDDTRKYEDSGLIERYTHHKFAGILVKNNKCIGIKIYDNHEGTYSNYSGPVIICSGGMNGMFPGRTTGTTSNTGSVTAMLFNSGVKLSNLEFIQYHPTTVRITDKRMLISEAARGEGGRLCYLDGETKVYFMEDEFGERGNLMPRDVVSKEIALINKTTYLDMTGLNSDIWNNRLSDLRQEIIDYLHKDPANELIEVAPGIHYFMGGINVNINHETNIEGLYAAGECAAAYHGANRLGGNSLLGAIYGGKTAAESIIKALDKFNDNEALYELSDDLNGNIFLTDDEKAKDIMLTDILSKTMGILRDETSLNLGLCELENIETNNASFEFKSRLNLAKAITECAISRRESRGAHNRTDYPESNDSYKKPTTVSLVNNEIIIE